MIEVAADRHSLSVAWQRVRKAIAARVCRWLLYASVPLFLVAGTFTYYGQLNRQPQSDTYGTLYTAVALVQKHTIWLDSYLPYFVQHGAGDYPNLPYMLTQRPDGHLMNASPTAMTILVLPAVGLMTAAGVKASNWGAWMEAGRLTAALVTAASVAVLFMVLLRLTTWRRSALIAATYAWGTLEWGISGQALWQHSGASLALAIALFGLVDRRFVLAGFGTAAMIACRPSMVVVAALLLPILGKRFSRWWRFLLGTAPFVVPFLLFSTVVLGSPLHLFRTTHANAAVHFQSGAALRGIPGLLVSPGRGLFVYSPVLLFALLGAVLGWRKALYRWCFIAAVAYIIVVANGDQWYGGESFGARKLTDIIPLLAVLLVPAVDAIVRTKWIWLYVALLAYSIFVEMLEASASPPDLWANGPHPPDLTKYSTWWHPLDNELVTMVQTHGLWPRMLLTAAIVACGIVVGRLTTGTVAGLRRSAKPSA
jgi:hypothetical protein